MYFDQSDIEKLAIRQDFKETVRDTTPYILKAVSFLHNELNVLEYKLLPYNIQLIFIMKSFERICIIMISLLPFCPAFYVCYYTALNAQSQL